MDRQKGDHPPANENDTVADLFSDGRRMTRYAFLPAFLATFVVNLIPLYGVLWWGWDTFQLLFLYWCETVVIAFWSIRRLAQLRQEQKHGVKNAFGGQSGMSLAGFFTLHAGMFIGVHFIFLWAFFSWDWFQKVHGFGSFFFELFAADGVWVAYVCMLILHGVSYFTDPGPGEAEPLEKGRQQVQGGGGVMPIVGGLYLRIVIMQIAILFGAWFSGFSGSLAPLVIVIVLKTLFDLGLTAVTSFKAVTAPAAETPSER